jgi:hypothetical protein
LNHVISLNFELFNLLIIVKKLYRCWLLICELLKTSEFLNTWKCLKLNFDRRPRERQSLLNECWLKMKIHWKVHWCCFGV